MSVNSATYALLFLTWLYLGATLLVFAGSEVDALLLMLATVIVLPPAIVIIGRENTHPLDPLCLLTMFFLLGTILKIPYLIGNPDAYGRLLEGRPPDVFLSGLLVITLGVYAFIAGYVMIPGRIVRRTDRMVELRWREGRLHMVVVGIFAATLATALLAIVTLGPANLIGNLSAKRFLDQEGASGRLGTALYLYYKFSLFAKIPALISLVYLMNGGRRWRSGFRIMMVLSMTVTILIPFVFNTRGNAVLAILDLGIVAWFLGARIRPGTAVILGGGAFVLFAQMTMARVGDRYSSVLDSVLGHRYFLELTKTSHIVDYFSTERIWFLGETMIGWLFVPIPSSIMADKPLFVDLGKYIGSNIFGQSLSGVPAGFVGELFLNFGLFGVLIGMFLTGLAMSLLWRNYLQKAEDPIVAVVTAMIVIRFSIFLFNNDLGTFMIKNLIETLPVYLALIFVAQRRIVSRPVVPVETAPVRSRSPRGSVRA